MRRREALQSIGTIAGGIAVARLLPGCVDDVTEGYAAQQLGGYAPNFEKIASDSTWGTTWTHVIPGRFSASHYTGLLLYNQATGYAEVHETDGLGRMVASPLLAYAQLGGHTGWTHVVPGLFGDTGYTGILLYDKNIGFARFYECTGNGYFHKIGDDQTGWRTSWSQIVAGFFTPSTCSSLLFYSPTEHQGEVWETGPSGLVGPSPKYQYNGWRETWTHIVAADFVWTVGGIDDVVFSDVLFYEGSTGHGELYRVDANGLVPTPYIVREQLLQSASSVVTGHFGGGGFADFALHDRAAATLSVYRVMDEGGTKAIVDLETLPLERSSIDVVVPGQFEFGDPDDHQFGVGPIVSGANYDRNWRAAAPAFVDVLTYDRAAGLAETFSHEPLPPPEQPLEGYITSTSSHGGAAPVATGSVRVGEDLSFHISSPADYTIDIYRQGWFQGVGNEQWMGQVPGMHTATGRQPIDRTSYRDGALWPVTVPPFAVPSHYPSGLYLARVRAGALTHDIPFVVRAPAPSPSKILLVITDTTYEAYNDWGGRSVYGFATSDGGQRRQVTVYPQQQGRGPYAFEVSFERPFDDSNGHGALENRPKWQKWEVPMLQWMMQQGIPVDVCTARDLHFEAPAWPNYRMLIFVGHHEYWTTPMRANTEAFARAGGGVAFLTGNTCWWQVRLSADGTRMQCYKVAGFDPLALTSPALTTVNWWNLPGGVTYPETLLTGVSWYGAPIPHKDVNERFTVTQQGHWAFAGTGLVDGATFGGFAGGTVVGPETDVAQSGAIPGMVTPYGYTIARVLSGGATYGSMGSFYAPNGFGEVFNTATIDWTFGLADTSPANKVPRITQNAIDRLGPKFRLVSGATANDIGVGADGTVWIVTNTATNGGFTIKKRVGSSWTTISGGALRIAVDPSGNPWVVNSVNSIFRLVDGWWQNVPGTATDIGISANGAVWIVGTPSGNGAVSLWGGSSWIPMGGVGSRIAVGPSGDAWVVQSSGAIYQYVGGWALRPGSATDIGVGPDGAVWAVGTATAPGGKAVYRWTGSAWRLVPGGAAAISVAPNGVPWIVSSSKQIFEWG